MPKGITEGRNIRIPCPSCGYETKRSIAWIKANDHFACAECNRTINLGRPQLLAGVEVSNDQVAEMVRPSGQTTSRR